MCEESPLSNVKNQEEFAGNGVVYLPVQSNDPECTTPYCNIDSICQLMTDDEAGDSLDKLQQLSKFQHAGSCVMASYDAMITAMRNPKNPERTWLYQVF